MGTRIAQHGLSPERLWALVAIAVACAYGVAVWGAAARGRVWGWRPYLRSANLNVAVGIAVLALFLALPILDFGGISAANQVSRLESGKVSAKAFDYDALKWDFGDGGRRKLAKLTKSKNAEVAKLAKEAQARRERQYYSYEQPDNRDERLANIHFQLEDAALRQQLEDFIRNVPNWCDEPCSVVDAGRWPDGTAHLVLVEGTQIEHLGQAKDGTFQYRSPMMDYPSPQATPEAGHVPKVEVRSWGGRQVYVDGQPVGQPFQ
jgi:hypothetical protein